MCIFRDLLSRVSVLCDLLSRMSVLRDLLSRTSDLLSFDWTLGVCALPSSFFRRWSVLFCVDGLGASFAPRLHFMGLSLIRGTWSTKRHTISDVYSFVVDCLRLRRPSELRKRRRGLRAHPSGSCLASVASVRPTLPVLTSFVRVIDGICLFIDRWTLMDASRFLPRRVGVSVFLR